MKSKFTHMEFREMGNGSCTNIVGRKDLFKNEEDFINDMSEEYEYIFESQIVKPTKDSVYISYVRYYPHFGESSGMDIDSGYTFCRQGRGAIEVYCIDF